LQEGCIPDDEPGDGTPGSESIPQPLPSPLTSLTKYADPAQPSPRPSNSVGAALRGVIWELLLGVAEVNAEEYVRLVELGPSRLQPDIQKDIRRTLAGEKAASGASDAHVASQMDARTRLLNAFAHYAEAAAQYLADDTNQPPAAAAPSASSAPPEMHPAAAVLKRGYVQGMGSLAAVLLAVLPEVNAFFAFRSLVMRGVPMWFEPGQRTIRAGCVLADQILAHADPELHRHFLTHYGPASTHADLMFYSRIASLYASRPPLRRVLRLWDAILAFGVHLLPVLCAAEAIGRRAELLAVERDAITRFQGACGRKLVAVCRVSMAFCVWVRVRLPTTAGASSC
jgi:cell cycle arrest protein BUB2